MTNTEKYAQEYFNGDIKAAIKDLTFNKVLFERKKYSREWSEEYRQFAIDCLREEYEKGNLYDVPCDLIVIEDLNENKRELTFDFIIEQAFYDIAGLPETNYTDKLANEKFNGNRKDAIKCVALYYERKERVKYFREWRREEMFFAQMRLFEHYMKRCPKYQLEQLEDKISAMSIMLRSYEIKKKDSDDETYGKKAYQRKRRERINNIIIGIICTIVLIIFYVVFFEIIIYI